MSTAVKLAPKLVKKPNVTSKKVVKAKAPITTTKISMGRGRPVGSRSFVPVLLSKINEVLQPGVTILVDRRFAKEKSLIVSEETVSHDFSNKEQESELNPSVTLFEESEVETTTI